LGNLQRITVRHARAFVAGVNLDEDRDTPIICNRKILELQQGGHGINEADWGGGEG